MPTSPMSFLRKDLTSYHLTESGIMRSTSNLTMWNGIRKCTLSSKIKNPPSMSSSIRTLPLAESASPNPPFQLGSSLLTRRTANSAPHKTTESSTRIRSRTVIPSPSSQTSWINLGTPSISPRLTSGQASATSVSVKGMSGKEPSSAAVVYSNQLSVRKLEHRSYFSPSSHYGHSFPIPYYISSQRTA